MIKVIQAYYQAFEENNQSLLNNVLHSELYGIRTYHEDLFFTNEEVNQHFLSNSITSVEIVTYDFSNEIYNLELLINKKPVLAKITIKDKRIYKVYEILKTNKRRIKCVCSYDGSPYSGYQKQKNASTIQGEIEDALQKIFKQEFTIHSSGRTDKGVHALNQVFHFDIESSIKVENIKKVLNSYLPDSIYIKDTEEVPYTFHSRYDVKVKTYQYVINLEEFSPIKANYEWAVDKINIGVFHDELQSIVGTHDFASFTKATDQNTVREIYKATAHIKENHLYITIEGNGFLRYMIRNIIGALVSINKGKLKHTIKDLLDLKDVNIVKDIAPACGLYLYDVKY